MMVEISRAPEISEGPKFLKFEKFGDFGTVLNFELAP